MTYTVRLFNVLDCELLLKTVVVAEGDDVEQALDRTVRSVLDETLLSPGDTIRIEEG